MKFTSEQIESEIYARFHTIYKAFGDFVNSGELWSECIAAIRDRTLLSHIIFCNDIHQIPPVNTFLRVKSAIIRRDLSEMEKRSVGAFWGFVFKFVFKYRNQKSTTARVNTVRTATYFFDIAEDVELVDAE